MKNKPRLFISMHYLELGGAESALIGLLQSLNKERVEVDLFLHDARGELVSFIPSWVNVLPQIKEYSLIERPIKQVLQQKCFKLFIARVLSKLAFKRYCLQRKPKDGSAEFSYVGHYTTKVLPSLHHLGEYYLAISFLTPHNIVLNKVKAQQKWCWIHTDYTHIDVNARLEQPIWEGYNKIVSISPDVTKNFIKVFPSAQSRIIEIENILSSAFIRERAKSEVLPVEMQKKGDEVILLTIGRYSYPKKLEEIPAICALLHKQNINVRWFIIGYGGSDEYIKHAIAKHNMEDFVVLLGKKENPYPYILACDWYVQPSRYEGKSIVVREAQILQKPVIVTAYPTASSQINHLQDGVIVPLELQSCANEMAKVLKNDDLKQHLIAYLQAHDFGNESEVNKIYAAMNA